MVNSMLMALLSTSLSLPRQTTTGPEPPATGLMDSFNAHKMTLCDVVYTFCCAHNKLTYINVLYRAPRNLTQKVLAKCEEHVDDVGFNVCCYFRIT